MSLNLVGEDEAQLWVCRLGICNNIYTHPKILGVGVNSLFGRPAFCMEVE